MAETTKIEWCDSTWNPWIGCTRVSLACDDCYAARSTPARTLGVVWGPHEPRHRTSADNWDMPKRWERQHEAFFAQHGRRRRVFCASLADVFDNAVPVEWLRDLCSLIEMTPNLQWLLLTKRIGNVFARLCDARSHDWLAGRDNAAIGITVVTQAEADRDIPKLLRLPARLRFLSIEPMLGPVDLTGIPVSGSGHHEFDPIITANVLSRAQAYPPLPRIDWVICGGESGPHARPMHPDWARSLRDQCAAAGVSFLFKQWGEWGPATDAAAVDRGDGIGGRLTESGRIVITRNTVQRFGKKAAGRLLDGCEHNGFPGARHA